MNWEIPGTVLTAEWDDPAHIEQQLRSMFLAGGIVLSQVASITGLEPYTVQNWVKRGFLTKPQQKKYTLRQLCRILNINLLKAALPMEEICGLLQYINNTLDDESDDLIDDSQLYFLFLRLVIDHRQMNTTEKREALLASVLSDYVEPAPGARDRVEKVLRIMLTAWAAAQMKNRVDTMMKELKNGQLTMDK